MSSEDDDNLPPAPKERKAPSIAARCGECMFFQEAATYKLPCKQLGQATTSRPCTRFLPNVYRVLDDDLVKRIMELPTDKLRMVGGLAHQEVQTRRTPGAHFGKIGYFRIGGGDYLSNYRRAMVLAVDGENYHLMGTEADSKIRASILKENFFDEKKWKCKEAVLRRRGALTDPDYKKFFQLPKPRVTAKYEPPTIDDERLNKISSDEENGGIVSIRGRKKKK